MGGMTQSIARSGFKCALLDGASGATNIAVTGIETEDKIISALHVSTKAEVGTIADITSDVSITSAGNIQCATTDTSNNQVLLFWVDKSLPGRAYNCIKCGLADGSNATVATLTGIAAEDTILFALKMSTKAAIATFTDVTTHVTATGANQITYDANYTNDQIWVFYHDNSGPGRENFNLQITLHAGAAANNNVAITGIVKTEDTIISAIVFNSNTVIATCADLTSECSITSDGNVQFSSTSTANKQVILFWTDNSI